MVDKFNIKKVKWFKGWKDLPTAYYPLKVPGITTIINDMIPDPDMDKFVQEVGEEKAKQIMEAAAHRGTAMHAFMEHFIKKLAESKDPSLALQFTEKTTVPLLEKEGIPLDKIDKGRDMFHNFYYSDYSNAYINLIGTEMPIYSYKLFFRGLIDVFYNELGIGRVVSDFKSSSKPIDPESIKMKKYKRQVGAYALAVEHMFKDKNVKIDKHLFLLYKLNLH